jgi:molybdenum cofactor cytidylyltransferase
MIKMVSAVVLAAEWVESNQKQEGLLPAPVQPALQRVLEEALASKVREVVCVVSDLASAVQHLKIENERLIWLLKYGADGGPNSSMIAGLWAIDPKSDGVLFLAGDRPFIRSGLIDALLERFESGHALIVAPSFQGQPRNPLLFRRELFPDLLKMTGGRSGFALLEKHRHRAELVPWAEEIPFIDIDVRTDYAHLKEPA